jgi:hypothetical protein
MLLLPFDVMLYSCVRVLVSQQIAQTLTGSLNYIIHARKIVPYRNKGRALRLPIPDTTHWEMNALRRNWRILCFAFCYH